MDETERLRLPAHAGALWRTTREITRRGIAELTGESGSYTIGGGTILAARWKHRSSSDIDIVVAEETRPGSVLTRPDSSFRNGIETLHGTVAPRARGKRVTAGWADQRIDIWATTPMPASGAAAAIVDGNIETVLSTIQILRGKLERGEDCLVRDVYDVLRASELDRGSLVAAANGAGRRWARTIAGIWQAAKTRIGARAETLDTVEALERPERLGAAAADAIRKAIYTRLEVGVDRGRILVSATTGFGDEKARTIAGVSDEAFERLGLNGYLAHQRPDGRRVRERAEEARRKSGRYTRIYSEENGQVTAWHGDVPTCGAAGQVS